MPVHKRYPTFEEWDLAVRSIAGNNPSVSPLKIFGHCREKPVVQLRWQAWRKLRDDGFSVTGIARSTGFDHTTIINAMTQMDQITAG